MNLCQLGKHLQLGPFPDGSYRMHLDGRDLHQFLLISTFSQLATVMEHSLVKVPDDVPLETVCLLGCGVGTGLGSSTNVAGVRPGDHVIVAGCGGVGSSALQGASLSGAASVIAVDPVAFKRETALALGATHAFATMAEATSFVRSITDGQGADAAILAMDAPTNGDVAEGFAAIAKGGTVVLTAMAAITEPVGIPVHLLELAGMQKSIRGNVFGMCNPPSDILRQIDLYRAGRLKLDEMITRRYQLDEINQAADDLVEGRIIRGVVTLPT
jgi:Zn-dependent alcohol dehydrogenase